MSDRNREPKWLKIYNRFAGSARDRLDDLPYLEKIIDATDVRADRFRNLREDVTPLRRLVISYTRGSYREAPKKDMAAAVAAISYVATPIDAIPDALPVGLKDDAKVVEFVAKKLSGTLGEYEKWERSLKLNGDLAQGIISRLELAQGSDMQISVLDRDEAVLADGGSGNSAAPAVQQIIRNSAQIERALHEGMALRVVGPKRLLKGISAETLELVRTGSGKTGTVRDVATKKFVGQLRVAQPGAAQAVKATVSIGFAVASAVTMQYYLHSIDSKLSSIKRDLENLTDKELDGQVGELDTALQRCRSVQEVLDSVGTIELQDHSRLDTADDRADDVFNALSRTLGRFVQGVNGTVGALDAVEKDQLSDLLKDATSKRLIEFEALIYAACVRDRVNAIRVLVAAGESDARMRLAEETLAREHNEMLSIIRNVSEALERLHVSKADIDARWPHLGGPEGELKTYSDSLARLTRDHAPSAATSEALDAEVVGMPALPPVHPTLTEFWMEDGELHSQQAEVRERVLIAA